MNGKFSGTPPGFAQSGFTPSPSMPSQAFGQNAQMPPQAFGQMSQMPQQAFGQMPQMPPQAFGQNSTMPQLPQQAMANANPMANLGSRFGQDMMYAGGTPYFNEQTGEYTQPQMPVSNPYLSGQFNMGQMGGQMGFNNAQPSFGGMNPQMLQQIMMGLRGRGLL